MDEKTTWDYYNLICEIECMNRQLRTDLQLRSVYRQKDDRSDAHIFMRLLAYLDSQHHALPHEDDKREEGSLCAIPCRCGENVGKFKKEKSLNLLFFEV